MMDAGSGRLTKIVLGAVVILAACSLADRIASSDPMLPIEIGVAVVLVLWTVALLRSAWRATSLSRELTRRSEPRLAGEIAYRIIPGRAALVAGLLRPSIYIGADLVRSLSDDELWAVLEHEDHHRITRAPLRTAALFAWLAVLGWFTLVQRSVSERLFELERSADSYALGRGVTTAALASALLHADAPLSVGSAGFSTDANRRALALLVAPPGELHNRGLPYEWLPLATVAAVAALCHLALIGVA